MISVDQLVYERFFAPVFQPVSFRLGAGGLLRITGANGSGKTTLIRVLAGLLEPTAGRVEVTADRIAYVGHQLALKNDLSVEENLRFFSNFSGTSSSSVANAIDALGLRRQAPQLARTLSAGQRKRCALARLLLSPARLWLLDEPYSNLDTEGCTRVDELLACHLAASGACVMATHGSHRPEVPVEDELTLQAGMAT